MIDVVLLSCDRLEYTKRTITSFLGHNGEETLAGEFRLWHCDDASTDTRVRKAASAAGFVPLIYTDQRVGVTEMIRRAARKLEHAGSEWLLLLENDWETVRPLPLMAWRDAVESYDVWAMRLYGAFKERDERCPAAPRHRGRSGADPQWRPAFATKTIEPTSADDKYTGANHGKTGEEYEVGHIHWGNPPSIARVDLVAWLHKNARREKDAIVKSGEIENPVARVVSNVVYHIGFERTAGFVS